MAKHSGQQSGDCADPVFLVVSEVAAILRYASEETVRAKYRNGTLPGKKVGGKWLALKHEIEQLAGVRLTRDPTLGWIVAHPATG